MLLASATVELVWQDETGSTSAVTLPVDTNSTIAQIDASASALASILVPMTGAVLIKQRIKFKAVPETPSVASGSTPIKYTGSFFYDTEDDAAIALVSVPALKEQFVLTDGPCAGICIDVSDSSVIDLFDALSASNAVNIFGDLIIELRSAYVQSRV